MNRKTTRKSGRNRSRGAALVGLAMVLAAAMALAACGDEEKAGPAGEPSITGVVTSASPAHGSDGVGSFLIEEGTGDYDKASVAVTGDTAWYRRTADGVEVIDSPSAGDLTGKTVEVQFTGPVAESYPVQATAGWVIFND